MAVKTPAPSTETPIKSGCPQIILGLVERFERDREAYKQSGYKEAELRAEFLNPFFEALGWDLANTSGKSETFKDVIVEEAIRIGGSTKAPDYTFRVGGARTFFVEAKKPSHDLQTDPEPAYQLRRYAWNAKLPLSILTDFEEFVVYDCRPRPAAKDKAATARILYLNYKDYAARWDEIAGLISKEAVERGSLERFKTSDKGKRGTSAVDDEFLEDIEHWRDMLARTLALRNKKLGERDLNFAAQRTLDRIIFLRICEDRGIEPSRQLQDLIAGKNIYGRLCALFKRADERYNSGIFHFHAEKDRAESPDELTMELKVDDSVLKEIIGHLYYPQSPYEFSVISSDILGSIYERFLGKVIRLTKGHHAVVEEKPEVKKAGGVYYTPTYIVDYIVKNTVGKLCEGKTPKEISAIRVLDPACGSGSFLIGAYAYLLHTHRDWYVQDGPEKHRKEIFQGPAGQWLLTTQEKKRILLNNIHGVDIDRQAVEVTKLSLLLKVLEHENQETLRLFHERALPDLGRNIKCGNSLIGPDYYSEKQKELFDTDEARRVNAFDWPAEFPDVLGWRVPEPRRGFDAVIGNPPYDVMEKERGESSWPHSALTDYVRVCKEYKNALGGKLNLFRFFAVRSLTLTRLGGRFGMIMSLALLADISCAETRRYLLLSSNDVQADCFPQKDNASRRVFKNAKLSTGIITCERSTPKAPSVASLRVRVFPWNSFEDKPRECVVKMKDALLLDPEHVPIPLVNTSQWALCMKLHHAKGVVRLGDFRDFSVTRGEINQTIYRAFITSNSKKARMLKGSEVARYCLHDPKQGQREWLDEYKFLKENSARQVTKQRRIATQRITGVDERLRVVATIIEPPTYFADSTNSITMAPNSSYKLEYLLALLNSRLFQWRFKLTSTNNNVGTNELESMPIRTLNLDDPAQKARHDRMVGLVDKMFKLYAELDPSSNDDTPLRRQIDATDREIDRLVYDLYGLTPDEIKIVEEGNAK